MAARGLISACLSIALFSLAGCWYDNPYAGTDWDKTSPELAFVLTHIEGAHRPSWSLRRLCFGGGKAWLEAAPRVEHVDALLAGSFLVRGAHGTGIAPPCG